MLVEQQAARSAAEGRVEADCLLEVLVRRSTEEQKLAQHLWQLQQEKVGLTHIGSSVAPALPATCCRAIECSWAWDAACSCVVEKVVFAQQ